MFKISVTTALFIVGCGIVAAQARDIPATSTTSNLRVGDVNISANNAHNLLTKTDASTGKLIGEQKFLKFKGMLWCRRRMSY